MHDLCFYLVVLLSLLAVCNTISKCSAHYYFDTRHKFVCFEKWQYSALQKYRNFSSQFTVAASSSKMGWKFHDQKHVLSDSRKCVCVAKSNFLLNMNYCSGQREICTGMSGHQRHQNFLTDIGTFEFLFDMDLVHKVWMQLIIMHSSSHACSTCNMCLYMKQVCLIQNHLTMTCSFLILTISTWTV
jgi:hypothetical protein